MFNKSKYIHLDNVSERTKKVRTKAEEDYREIIAKLRELFCDTTSHIDIDEPDWGNGISLIERGNILKLWLDSKTIAKINGEINYARLHTSTGERSSISIETESEYLPIIKEFAKWYVETADGNTPSVYINF